MTQCAKSCDAKAISKYVDYNTNINGWVGEVIREEDPIMGLRS